MNKTASAKAAIAIGAGALFAIALPMAASAHVTITPNTAPAGSYALVTFKVPTESATATTTKLEVDIPTDTPFSSVSYVAVTGWDTQLVTETLPKPVKIGGNELTEAVTKVIWTAQPGFEIKQHQLQLFPLSVGSVPDTGKIELNAIQTYSDGSIVKWAESGADAEHPSPALFVNDTPAGEEDSSHSATATTAVEPTSSATPSDVIARVLGIGGLVFGAVGIVLAVVFSRRTASNR